MTKEIDNAFRQASMTADDYLTKAMDILKGWEVKYTLQDAIALAHIMALDFNATILHTKLQEIRDAIESIWGKNLT